MLLLHFKNIWMCIYSPVFDDVTDNWSSTIKVSFVLSLQVTMCCVDNINNNIDIGCFCFFGSFISISVDN